MKVFVTGSSSGLGYALIEHYLSKGAECFGISRSVPDNAERYRFEACDVQDTQALDSALECLFTSVDSIDLLFLNAGTLGRIQDMSECGLDDLKMQMDVNLWANKVILDFFIKRGIAVKQVIAISSGASVNGSLGWNGYSLSKAALNMMMKLYAREMPQTHLCALAPGLIETPMLGTILYGDHDTERYSSVQVLRDAKNSGRVMSPDEAALAIDNILDALKQHESGSFLDIRQM